MRRADLRHIIAAVLLWLSACLGGPASAQDSLRWTSSATEGGGPADKAGLVFGSVYDTLYFACQRGAGDSLSLIFTGFERSLAKDILHTVAVSVDGTAFLFRTTAEFDEMDEDTILSVEAPFDTFRPLIAALKAGKEVEISSPDGRVTASLRGSGKALAELEAGCAP